MKTVTCQLILAFLFAVSVPVSHAQTAPAEVLEAWNNALYAGNVDLAHDYTSSTSLLYLREKFGGVEGLSQKYRQRPVGGGKPNRVAVETTIEGDRARVVQRSSYPDGSIRLWEDVLLLENGAWKVAPQHYRVRVLSK